MQLVDCLCTYLVLRNGGIETNPIVLMILNTLGYGGIVAAKAVVTALIGFRCFYTKSVVGLTVANVMMFYVCVWMLFAAFV